MKKLALIGSLPLILSLTGCVISISDDEHAKYKGDWEQVQKDNRHTIALLNVGDSRKQVMSQLGDPSFSESFTQNEKTYQVYYFRTQRVNGDGKTTKDETTPVVFLNGKLIGWGESALNKAMSISS